MTITEEKFREATGEEPVNDDIERSNCERAGMPGHWTCGWCDDCDMPVFMCGHRKPERPKDESVGV